MLVTKNSKKILIKSKVHLTDLHDSGHIIHNCTMHNLNSCRLEMSTAGRLYELSLVYLNKQRQMMDTSPLRVTA
jgi:hypothetical protein